MTHLSRLLTCALAASVVGTAAAAPAAPPARARPGPPAPAPRPATLQPPVSTERTLVDPNSVLVFPFEKPPAPPADQPQPPSDIGTMIAGQMRAGLNVSGKYTAATYYPNSPLIMRVLGPGGLTAEDVNKVIDPQRGTIDPDRANHIATAVGVASMVVGSVEEFRYDSKANTASVTATVQWLSVPSGTPIKTVGVTGSATAPLGTPSETVIAMAARDVAKRALTEMGVPAPKSATMTTAAAKGRAKKSSKSKQAPQRNYVD